MRILSRGGFPFLSIWKNNLIKNKMPSILLQICQTLLNFRVMKGPRLLLLHLADDLLALRSVL